MATREKKPMKIEMRDQTLSCVAPASASRDESPVAAPKRMATRLRTPRRARRASDERFGRTAAVRAATSDSARPAAPASPKGTWGAGKMGDVGHHELISSLTSAKSGTRWFNAGRNRSTMCSA
jgi:hypothetical protein